jgi:aspartate kinase
MIVNKFGGASVKDETSICRMAEICKKYIPNGVIIVSAMGKTTNLLEELVQKYVNGEDYTAEWSKFKSFHTSIIEKLFPANHLVFEQFSNLCIEFQLHLNRKPSLNYDFEYDQVVSYGELASTIIIAAYLNLIGLPVIWRDARNSLKTDSTYREGKINWELSSKLIPIDFANFDQNIYLTQGFIGTDLNNLTTTLGREGSDYTAAIFANILNADRVVVWKDVPGVMCADPAWIPDPQKLDTISYREAIELTFFGATVIHPKTLKPLQVKKILLQVRSFLAPEEPGTFIGDIEIKELPPVFIRKQNQVLISISPTDLSFIVEENLSHIFSVFAKYQIKVNLMQNSAISFSVTVNGEMQRVHPAIAELKLHYDVKYNDNLDLITIRHYAPGIENQVIGNRKILVEQKSRTVARYLVKNITG